MKESMKKFFTTVVTSIIIALLAVNAQMPADLSKQNTINTSILQEQVVLNTDRNLYAASEPIRFMATYFNNSGDKDLDWSKVLYVELIRPDGVAQAQGKYTLGRQGTSGTIVIPSKTLSGTYYLKAYTKWMRNFPVDQYAYKKIKVVNATNFNVSSFETEVEEGINLTDETWEENNQVILSTDKEIYAQREGVKLIISQSLQTPEEFDYQVSVIKKGTKKFTSLTPVAQQKQVAKQAAYLPEISGLTLSGQVVATNSREAVSGADVHLSLLNHQSYFGSFKSKNDGSFYFNFPLSNDEYDFFISAHKDNMELNIKLDNDFCQRKVNIETEAFSILPEEKELIEQLIVDAQLNKIYEKELTRKKENLEDTTTISFYGTPKRVVLMSDYIELPALEEFLLEIIPEVYVNYNKGIPEIKPSKFSTFQNYPFLVMVDNIPLTNISEFLNAKPKDLDRIELIDKSYIIGDMKYSGVINAISKERDMASVELPENSMFFNFQLYANDKEPFNASDYFSDNSQIPDRRYCLYWNPYLDLNSENKAEIDFSTSDLKGTYEVVVKIISKYNRKVSYAITEFSVE
jgi:hypothetical protein